MVPLVRAGSQGVPHSEGGREGGTGQVCKTWGGQFEEENTLALRWMFHLSIDLLNASISEEALLW